MKAYLYVLDTLADWEIAYIMSEFHSGRYLDIAGSPIAVTKLGFNKKVIDFLVENFEKKSQEDLKKAVLADYKLI